MVFVGKSLLVKQSACVNCGKTLDAACEVSEDGKDHGPSPGAITICVYCGHFMAFDDDMSVRELTDEEMLEIGGDRRVIAISQALAKARAK